MIKGMRAFLCMLCLGMGMITDAGAQQPEEITTVIIMRHAEKENSKDPDPDLSAAGKQRAAHLAILFKDVPVAHLLTTPYKRTRQTLEVLAKEKNLPVDTYDPAKMSELLSRVRNEPGQTFVIAGHANTVPELVNELLGQQKYNTLAEQDFGKVWILTLHDNRVLSCILLNTN